MQIKCYINCRNYKSAVNEYNACISPLCGNVKLKSHVSLHPEPRDLPTYISIYISQNASICTDLILYLTINHCLVRFFIFVPPPPIYVETRRLRSIFGLTVCIPVWKSSDPARYLVDSAVLHN